jgi:uncharacterized glyoxalase superfamily protein PhnB
MKINSLTPILYSNDIQSTIEFYVKTLEFECVAYELEWGWARVKFDNVEIMISKPNDHNQFDKSNFTGSFYLNVDNVDEIWNKINQNVKVCYPIENFDYGMREFAIYDNNDYLLQFGQDMEVGE